ncbi:MAG: FAD-binding oxidoreductase [Acetobacteraceae bacterium]|nr:FAD-binding oxidoreductase [Acetobacteraceae bacterium]
MDDLAASLWWHTAPPAPAAPPLVGDVTCEVAIIGAGILGLATALALAEAGIAVRVLEADRIGSGASGRNGGLVVPSLPRIGPSEVAARLPHLPALVAGSAAATFALIRRHGIACDAVQNGWLMPAHAASLAPRVRQRVAAWQQAGSACSWLDTAEARARLGSPHLHGALFDPTGGHLHPLAYARGLARAAIAAGAVVHEHTPVISLRSGFALGTPGGTVRAGRVLQATNAMPPGVPGRVGRAIRDGTVPLIVYQLATQVLPDAARASVLPGDNSFSDTRNNLLAGRWTADGRLVAGGMAMLHAGAGRRVSRHLARRLTTAFPSLPPLRFDYVWRGRAALTGDFLPRLMQPEPGWLAATACNGRGVALNTALAPLIAAFLAGGDAEALPLPLAPASPFRWPRLARLVPQLLLPLGDWRDRRA